MLICDLRIPLFGYPFFTRRSSASQSYVKVHEIKAHDTYLLKCVLSPNVEKLVTTSADKTVKVWDTKTWTHQRTLVSLNLPM